MSSMVLSGEGFNCPHCNKQLIGTIERYSFRSGGSIKENKCFFCQKLFYVECLGKGKYFIDTKSDDEYDEYDDDSNGKKW